MTKYLATVKRPNYAKPIVVRMEAPNVRAAIDDMYAYVGATTSLDIDEYELLEVVGDNRYRPVAYKGPPKDSSTKPESGVAVKEYKEKHYTSYRDVA